MFFGEIKLDYSDIINKIMDNNKQKDNIWEVWEYPINFPDYINYPYTKQGDMSEESKKAMNELFDKVRVVVKDNIKTPMPTAEDLEKNEEMIKIAQERIELKRELAVLKLEKLLNEIDVDANFKKTVMEKLNDL